MGSRGRPVLSVLVPVYNERENLGVFYQRLSETLNGLHEYDPEVIFIDDGSNDGSFEILCELHKREPRIKILRLSRNFGSWNALLAGARAAKGHAVVWITSDLQDPPELIPKLARRWEDGAHVVWAVRTQRDDPLPRRLMAWVFYRVLRRISLPGYPLLGMDICLMDREVASLFARLDERNRFTQALIMGLGFRQEAVPYERERRRQGKSKWGNFPRLSKIGIDMVVGSSYFPLRAMAYTGLLMAGAAILLGAIVLVGSTSAGLSFSPWTSLALVVIFVGGLNALMLGILGEYVWRILDEVRGRPQYVIRERIGFEPAAVVSGTRQPHGVVEHAGGSP